MMILYPNKNNIILSYYYHMCMKALFLFIIDWLRVHYYECSSFYHSKYFCSFAIVRRESKSQWLFETSQQPKLWDKNRTWHKSVESSKKWFFSLKFLSNFFKSYISLHSSFAKFSISKVIVMLWPIYIWFLIFYLYWMKNIYIVMIKGQQNA